MPQKMQHVTACGELNPFLVRSQLYTSGSTGKPKGVEHTQAGYMVGAYATFKYAFDYHQGQVYWCTADCGWITGHSYVTYGMFVILWVFDCGMLRR